MHKFPALTSIRFFAALFVMCYHFLASGNGLLSIFELGYLGVDIFFILSGFIILHTYIDAFDHDVRFYRYFAFMRLRFARIWPMHMLTLTLSYALYVVAKQYFATAPKDEYAYTLASLAANLTMTHAWFPGVAAPNVPAWSISAEWFMYLLFPFGCLILVNLPRLAVHGICGLCAIGVVIVFGSEEPAWSHHPLLRIVLEFTIGMGLYLHARAVRPRLDRWRWGGVSVIGALTVLLASGSTSNGLYIVVFASLIFVLSGERDLLARCLDRPGLRYLGEISYSIYLLHSPVGAIVVNVVRKGFPRFDPTSPAVGLISIVASILLAGLTYRLVELPARRWLRGGRPPRFART